MTQMNTDKDFLRLRRKKHFLCASRLWRFICFPMQQTAIALLLPPANGGFLQGVDHSFGMYFSSCLGQHLDGDEDAVLTHRALATTPCPLGRGRAGCPCKMTGTS